MIEIARGKIPTPSRLIRFFQLWRQIARYSIAKNQYYTSKSEDYSKQIINFAMGETEISK